MRGGREGEGEKEGDRGKETRKTTIGRDRERESEGREGGRGRGGRGGMEIYKEDYLSYAKARNQARSACRKAVRLYEKEGRKGRKEGNLYLAKYT